MELLPDLIVDKIFNLLPLEDRLLSLDLVCDRWNRLMPYHTSSKHPKSARSPNVKVRKAALEVGHLASFVNEVRSSSKNKDADFDFLLSLLSHVGEKVGDYLTEVTFSESPLYQNIRTCHLQTLLSNSTSLSILVIHQKIKLQPDAIRLLPLFGNLEKLTIGASDENEEALSETFPHLRSLRLLRIDGSFNRNLIIGDGSNIILITIPSLIPFDRCLVESEPLPQSWPNLQRIYCSNRSEIERYRNDRLIHLLGLFPSLQRTNLANTCYGDDLTDVVYRQPYLTSLAISTSSQGLQLPFGEFDQSFQNLRKLELSACQLTTRDVSWTLGLPNLISLKFDHCFFIPLMPAGVGRSLHVACNNLKTLRWTEGAWSEMKFFYHYPTPENPDGLNPYAAFNSEADFVLMSILSNCDRLETVFIDAYYPELAHRLATYAETSGSRSLRTLGIRLSGVYYIKTGIVPLTNSAWPSVRNLTFVHEGKFEVHDDAILRKFTSAFPNLRHLTFREPYVGGPGTEIQPFSAARALLHELPFLSSLSGIQLPYDWPIVCRFFEAVAEHKNMVSVSCTNLALMGWQRPPLNEVLLNTRNRRRKEWLLRRFVCNLMRRAPTSSTVRTEEEFDWLYG